MPAPTSVQAASGDAVVVAGLAGRGLEQREPDAEVGESRHELTPSAFSGSKTDSFVIGARASGLPLTPKASKPIGAGRIAPRLRARQESLGFRPSIGLTPPRSLLRHPFVKGHHHCCLVCSRTNASIGNSMG